MHISVAGVEAMPEDPSYPTNSHSPQPDEWSDEDWSDEVVATDEAMRALQDALAAEEHEHEAWEDESLLEWEEEPEAILDDPSAPTTAEAIAWLQPAGRTLKSLWSRLLRGIRQQIPAVAKLSDGVLSGILIMGLVLILTLLGGVGRPGQAQVSGAEPSPVSRQMQAFIRDDVNASATISPSLAVPTGATGSESLGRDEFSSDRIASLQAQLMDASLPLARGVIQSVQVDFVENRLVAILSEDWYRLSKYDQAELANQLWARSRTLSFDDLVLQTEAGDVLARKPIVGNSMVILQHEPPPAVPIPPRPRFRITVDR